MNVKLLCCLFVLAIFFILSFIFELNSSNLIFIMLANFIFFGLFLYFFSNKKYIFFLSIPFIFAHVITSLSSLYLDFGAYMPEVRQYSEIRASTSRLIFFVSAFLYSITLGYGLFSRLSFKYRISCYFRQVKTDTVVLLISVPILIVLAFSLTIWGSPLGIGIQRFEYWSSHSFPLLRNVLYQGFFIAFLIGILYVRLRYKKLMIFIIFLFCIINILYGEKFTGIFLTLMYFFIGYLFSYQVVGVNKFYIFKFKVILLSLLFLLLMLMIVYYQYKYIHHVSGSIPDYILARIFSMQAQVWWAIDNEVFNYGNVVNIDSMLYKSNCGDYTGLYYLMSVIASEDIVNSYCQRGVSFTMGYPAILIYNFGYLYALVINAILGVFVGMTFCFIIPALKSNNVISIFLCFKIIIIETHAFNMGDLNNVFEVKFIIYILLVFFLNLFHGKVSNEKNNSILFATISSNK